MKKTIVFISCLLLLTFLVTGCGSKTVAVVNGEKISESELQARLEQIAIMYNLDLNSEQDPQFLSMFKERILEGLIEEKLVLQEAKEKNFSVSKEELKKEVEEIKANFQTDKDYQNFLKERKFSSEKELSFFIKNQLIFNKLFEDITKDLTKPSQDVEEYYEEHKEEFFEPEQVRARHILVEKEEEAKAIIERLDKGEDFAKLAVELSIDPTAKDNQGDVDYFHTESQLVQEFKDAAFKLKVGEYTKVPVKTTFGYHVIKVEDKKAAHQVSFKEVQSYLEEQLLLEEKDQKFNAYLDELVAKATIERKLPKEEETKENSTQEENKEEQSETK